MLEKTQDYAYHAYIYGIILGKIRVVGSSYLKTFVVENLNIYTVCEAVSTRWRTHYRQRKTLRLF